MTLAAPRTLVYQIFVDRFAGRGGRALDPLPTGVEPWRHHAGGTLDGIAERLEHVTALGADALYLTPIFRAPSNHKYDTASFDEVDPAFGGEPALDALVSRCRALGLGLVLDGVFNHVGETHPWFVEARGDAASARASFFKFALHPDEFARWRGHGSLPELDLDRDAVVRELVDGERSVLRRWIRRGATGFRLDCANDLGLSVCARATLAAREEGATDGVIGEVMTYAEAWVNGGALDGLMNYYFRESVLGLVTGAVPPIQAAHNLEHMAARYRKEALLRSWNVLATHDTPRLATLVKDERARRLAWTLAFTYPGVPLVYYGEEIGREGGPDPDNRRPMEWREDAWHRPTLAHVQALARLRRERRALVEGDLVPFAQPGDGRVLAFARTTADPAEVTVVIANATAEPIAARVFTPYSFLFDHLPLVDRLSSLATHVEAGRVDVALEPYQAVVLAPDDTTIPGYRFFRAR